ncbi:MAG: DUF2150 family protein [Halobacteriales archaeon]
MEDEGFYSEERWENWMESIRETELDPDDDDSALPFFNLQDDVTIACTKVLDAYDDGDLTEEDCLEGIQEIREVVMQEESFDDEEKEMLLEGVQTSLIGVLASCENYVANGAADDAEPEEYVDGAFEAEREEDLDAALGMVAEAGARVIEEEEFEAERFDDVEYGFVSEWVNGLSSLKEAVEGPEKIEED